MTKAELLEKSKELLQIAERIQDESISFDDRKNYLASLREQYHNWYRASVKLFDTSGQEGIKQKFESEYEGSFWSAKILDFPEKRSGCQKAVLFDIM